MEIFVGIDWGGRTHSVCALGASGQVLWEAEIAHTREAVIRFREKVLSLVDGQAASVKAAMETPRGTMLEVLLESGVEAYSINPKQLDRFRDRHAISGAKDDRLDAYVLADSLRTDTHLYRSVRPSEAEILRLRNLSRSYESLMKQSLQLGAQISEELRFGMPEWEQLGQWHRERWLWELFELASSGKKVSFTKLQALLKRNRIRRVTAEDLHALLKQSPVPLSEGSIEALRERVVLLLPVIRATHEQKELCEKRMKTLLDTLSDKDGESQEQGHHDAAIVLSLPGIGTKNGAVILTCSDKTLEDRNVDAFRALSGTRPVSRRTGGKKKTPMVQMRRSRNIRLSNAILLWAQSACNTDSRCRSHYVRLRAKGASHCRALRGVADRLIAVLFSMLRTGTLFDTQQWNRSSA